MAKKFLFFTSLLVIVSMGSFYLGKYNADKETVPTIEKKLFGSHQHPGILNQIRVEVVDEKRFYAIENPYVVPGEGKVFLAFLVEITNNSPVDIYGGGSDYHSTFEIVTNEGYVIEAENTSSEAWRQNRIVWNVEYLSPGEKGKGWIVFAIPEDVLPEFLVFDVDKYNSPHSLTGLGKIKIRLPT